MEWKFYDEIYFARFYRGHLASDLLLYARCVDSLRGVYRRSKVRIFDSRSSVVGLDLSRQTPMI